MSDNEIMVHKVILTGGKVVLLREMKIRHQRLASQAAQSSASDNPITVGMAMAEEILKLLIVQVDGKDVAKASLEDLDSVFKYAEYQQLMRVMEKLMGLEEGRDAPKMELVSFGSG